MRSETSSLIILIIHLRLVKMSEFIPYGRQDIDENDIAEVEKVLRSEYLTSGPKVPEFEQKICHYTGARHSVAFNSATSALHVALLSLQVGKNDWVWTSTNTFVASANCAEYVGANVDFLDIDIQTGQICLDLLEVKLKKASKCNLLPKVIIPVHFGGACCDMERLHRMSLEYSFMIVEDASHALGASFNNDKVGNCKYSVATIFSLHPVKIITSGEGGILTTNIKSLHDRCCLYRSHGITRDSGEFVNENQGLWHYEQHLLGFNYRLSDIHAALGLSQLRRLDKFIKDRTAIRQFYEENLNCNLISLIQVTPNCESSHHLAVVSCNLDSEQHKQVFERLRSQGIGVQLHYEPVHLQPYYQRKGIDYNCPNAEYYAQRSFSLPIFPSLSQSSLQRICSQLEYELKNL